MNRLVSRVLRRVLLALRLWIPFGRTVVIGRTACLGQAVFDLRHKASRRPILVNQQKARVDSLLEMLDGHPPIRSRRLRNIFVRNDVFKLIRQQEKFPYAHWKDCDYILWDSFSELTDQKFVHKKGGWAFYSHYSDVRHSPEFDEQFSCEGLIPLESIEPAYRRFFAYLGQKFPQKKIVYIHFSAKLDSRVSFKSRETEIRAILKRLEPEFPQLLNIYIDDSAVERHEDDAFPYHYGQRTNKAYLDRWVALEPLQ